MSEAHHFLSSQWPLRPASFARQSQALNEGRVLVALLTFGLTAARMSLVADSLFVAISKMLSVVCGF